MLACRTDLAEKAYHISDPSHHQLLSNYDDNTKMKPAYLSSGGSFLLYSRQLPLLICLERENPLEQRKINARKLRDLRSPQLSS